MGKIMVWLPILLSAILAVSCGESPVKNPLPQGTPDGYKEITQSGMTLRWKVDNQNLKVVVRAPTAGWVAAGFSPTDKMQDANIIIGYVKDGQAYLENDFGTGPVKHEAQTALGGVDNLMDKSGMEADGYTEIWFTMPLNSNDSKHPALEPGKTYKVILAYGAADDFKMYHTARTAVNIKIE
ncbi:MAG TPA: DOMON domain-containing protein [Planctomycetota bacterium]|nr:DOMON domain-containing protein [Planctomycetota bacterium]